MDKVTVTLGAGTLGLAIFLGYLLNQLHAERAQLAERQIHAGLPEAGTGPGGSTRAQSSDQAPAAQTPVAPADSSTKDKTSELTASAAARLADFSDPQYRAAAIASRRSGVRLKLRDLSQWMRMSDQGLEVLVGLLATHSVEDEELHLSTLDERNIARVRQQEDVLQQRQDADIAQVLGAQRYREWKTYREAEDARRFLSEMNGQLSAGDMLVPEELRPLATAMMQAERNVSEDLYQLRVAEASQKDASAAIALAERRVALSRKQNELAREAVARRLSVKQLAALDAVLGRSERTTEAALASQRALVTVGQ